MVWGGLGIFEVQSVTFEVCVRYSSAFNFGYHSVARGDSLLNLKFQKTPFGLRSRASLKEDRYTPKEKICAHLSLERRENSHFDFCTKFKCQLHRVCALVARIVKQTRWLVAGGVAQCDTWQVGVCCGL